MQRVGLDRLKGTTHRAQRLRGVHLAIVTANTEQGKEKVDRGCSSGETFEEELEAVRHRIPCKMPAGSATPNPIAKP